MAMLTITTGQVINFLVGWWWCPVSANRLRSVQCLPLLLALFCSCFLVSRGFQVPPPSAQEDRETNRVLQQFIWEKIIGAPTDPKRAFRELQEAVAAEQSKHQPSPVSRSLVRRSSYSSSAEDDRARKETATSPAPGLAAASSNLAMATASLSEPHHAHHSYFSNPSISNKYIPEYGAKELYTLVAASAGSPDAIDIPLPAPPPPSPVTSTERPSTTAAATAGSTKPSTPMPAQTVKTSFSGGPPNLKNYFTMHKVTKHSRKVPSSGPTKPHHHHQKEPVASASSQQHTKTASGGHQQAQSQSIYDILPMPDYGTVNGQEQQSAENYDQGLNGYGEGLVPPPPPPPGYEQQFEAKRTFEVVPMIDQQHLQVDEEIPQPFVPIIPPPPPPPGAVPILPVAAPVLPAGPQIIDVIPDEQPIQIVFRSTSARVNVKQVHMPVASEEVETTRTEEKPQRVLHQLVRPIVQEVFEIIQPYRRVTQEIRPVLEEIRTVVAKQSDTPQRPRFEHGKGGPGGKW